MKIINLNQLLILCVFISYFDSTLSNSSPILDVDSDVGYHGKIGEKNSLVDLTPHLQIKNIEDMNGICSYHVYKPNDEDFPFIIDIKDKYSGEAVIQLGQNEITNQYNEIDCKKRKFYKFFIEAHDCTEPVSLASEKIPVTIEIVDHNDYKLKFAENDYYASLTENKIDDAILIVKAKDDDCTNDGFACSYKLINNNNENDELPFEINKLGFIKNSKILKKSDKSRYDFIVRAYDCLDSNSFAETNIHIDIEEPCHPEWADYNSLVNATSVETQIFNNKLKLNLCNDDQTGCSLLGYETTIELDLNKFPNDCEVEKCGEVYTKFDFLDNTDSDENKEPNIFESFNRSFGKTVKSNFDGNFGNKFQLKVWIRRSYKITEIEEEKEHVFCGSDSELLNRHHYGLYFYGKKIKFLLRREKELNNNKNNDEEFYPSLWEWSIDSLSSDSKWHLYEIKYNYPNTELFIDNIRFEENQTNSDIIDAQELDKNSATGLHVTYIGACYNARTHTFSNFFNGDIAGLSLYKEQSQQQGNSDNKIECIKNCKEYLDLNMIGNEYYLKSIDLIQNNQIKLKTQTIFDLIILLQKINYINKNLQTLETLDKTKIGKRFVKLKTEMKCLINKNNKSITDTETTSVTIKELIIDIDVKKPKQEFNIEIDGNRQYLVSKNLLINKGIYLFKDIRVNKISINKVNELPTNDIFNDDNDDDDSDKSSSSEKSKDVFDVDENIILFSSCSIRVLPAANNLNEKFILTEFNNDNDDLLSSNDDFKLSKNNDVFIINGLNSIENYQNYLRNLIYVINIDNKANNDNVDVQQNNLFKQFYLSCTRSEPNIETNTVFIQLNITENEPDYLAFKKMHKFTADDGVVENKMFDSSPSNSNTLKASSPAIVILIVVCSGLLGFVLVFTAIRMKNSRGRRRGGDHLNEENPQMEWDDSGLNITENPLEELEANEEGEEEEEEEEEQRHEYEDDYSSTEESDNENYYNSEEEPEKIVDKELEWDNTTLEINENKCKKTKSNLENAKNTYDA